MRQRKTNVWLFMATVCACMLASSVGGQEPGGLSQLVDPKGLNDPVLRWNACLIAPQGNAPVLGQAAEDYATRTLKDAWDFDEDDLEGITRFSDGIKNPKVENGALTFTVGDKPFFYWGDHFDDPDAPGLQLGKDWPAGGLEGYLKWAVQMRVKQSADASTWTVSARRAGSSPSLDRKDVEIKGTEWQEVTVVFGLGRAGIGRPARRRHSLCIEPGGEGNQVQIDWVKAVRIDSRKYLRKTLPLDKPIKSARLCVVPTFSYKLYINGKQVSGGLFEGLKVLDVTSHFRVGENVIAYEDHATYRSSKEAAIEGCVIFEDGTFQRLYTDKTWKGTFEPAEGWHKAGFDDSQWAQVKQGPNVGKSVLTIQHDEGKDGSRGRGRGYGIFLDPPYFGPVSLTYPDKKTPADTPAFFPVSNGARVRVTLPRRSTDAAYEVEYELMDALTEEKLDAGSMTESGLSGTEHVYDLHVKGREPGPYHLVVTARCGGDILDRRFGEFALIGRVPQREVPWRDVDKEVKKRLIAEIECGDPDGPYEMIEHPGKNYKKGMDAPSEPMTGIEQKDGKAYRVLSDAFGDWMAWKIPMKHPGLPHLLEVEYPDDRPQSFCAYARDRTYDYYKSFGAQVCRRGAVWCLNDTSVLPLTGDMKKASFIFYPQSGYPYLSVELMNMFADGRQSAVYKIRVYEITDLPAPKIANPQQDRWFGGQTERPALRAITYYNGFYNGGDAKHFANIYRCRLIRHHGFVRDWYITYANQIRRMRFAGENMFMCGFWMYHAPFWVGSDMGRRGTTQKYDNFAMMFAMFGANDMFLLPWIEYCQSDRTVALNVYTDKEVAQGAPTALVVSKDGRQATFSGAGANPYNVLDSRVQDDLLRLVREIRERYSRYEGFRGIAFGAGGFCMPCLYNVPRALSWEENLEWGWGDTSIQKFEEMMSIKVPVAAEDPERFNKRYTWVMNNARPQWVEFRKAALTSVHKALAEEVGKVSDEDDYYLFAWMTGDALMRSVTLKHQDLTARVAEAGLDIEALKREPGIQMAWVYRPESFGVSHRLKPGLCKTFNNLDQVNEALDNGEATGCFLDVVWSEPDYGNFLYPDWVWKGHTQNNPNPWYSGLFYPTPFADRLSHMTPGLMGFCLTDGLLYTAQNDARRPVGIAYRSIPKGEYVTLEGNSRERNIVIRESVSGDRRSFYVVNPVWWQTDADIKLSGDTQVKDLVDDQVLKGDTLTLHLGPYDIRVFDMPSDVTIVSAESEAADEGVEWVKEALACFAYLDKLGVKNTLRRFSLPEPLDVSVMRLSHLRHLFAKGDYVKARRLLYHPWVIRVMEFLRDKKRVDESGGLQIRTTYRVNVGSKKPYRDAQGREWLPDQDFNYGVLSYGYLENEQGMTLYRGKDREVAKTQDPEIYRHERFRHVGHGFLVPEGSYTVKLHYAEMFKYRPDQEATDSGVVINGKPAYANFNLGKEAGGKDIALVKTVKHVKPVDGRIEIRFSDPKLGGRCQGIEVIKEEG